MARVLLIDKQELFRHSFKTLIESEYENEVVLGTSTFEEAREKLHPGMAELLIADIQNLEKSEWLDFEDLLHDHPALKLMIVSDEINKSHLAKLMELRVRAYFSKLAEPSSILKVIRSIESENYNYDLKLGPFVRSELTSNSIKERSSEKMDLVEFTERELQILDFIKKEWSSKEIAAELNISSRTVETHRRRMMEKTNSRSIIGVVVYTNERRIF